MTGLVRVAVVAMVVAWVGGWAAAADPSGDALFSGQEPLNGRIRGHRSNLPADVVRCRNCHRLSGAPPAARGTAPVIDRPLLLAKIQRRGGPPSSYDPASFCKLLRTGIDPAYILISGVMPVYEIEDAQCQRLWDFLTRVPHARAKRECGPKHDEAPARSSGARERSQTRLEKGAHG